MGSGVSEVFVGESGVQACAAKRPGGSKWSFPPFRPCRVPGRTGRGHIGVGVSVAACVCMCGMCVCVCASMSV